MQHKKYQDYFINDLLYPDSTDNSLAIKHFTVLLRYFDLSQIKLTPYYKAFSQKALKGITAQYIFDYAITHIIKNNRLGNLKFLIDDCKFNFTNLTDENKDTLLHLACLKGNKEIISYLLENNFDVNAKNNHELTPLVYLMSSSTSASLIPLFKKKNANFNITDKTGFTAQHYAIFFRNSKTIVALKSAGADQNTTWKKLGFNDIANLHRTKKLEVDIKFPILQAPEKLTEINAAEFLVKLFQPKITPLSFKQHILFYKKSSEALSDVDSLFFFYALIASEAYTKNNILKHLKVLESYVGKVVPKLFFFDIIGRTINFFLLQNNTDIVAELNGILHALLIKEKNSFELYKHYLILTSTYNAIQLPQKGVEAGEYALSLFPELKDYTQACLYYNLGISYEYLLKEKLALENFKKAFELVKDDGDFFERYFWALLKDDPENSTALTNVCSQSQCGVLTVIHKLYLRFHLQEISSEVFFSGLSTIETESMTNYSTLIFDLKTNCYRQLGNHEKAMEYARISLKSSEDNYVLDHGINIGDAIAKFIKNCFFTNHHTEALSLIESNRDKYFLEFNHHLGLKCSLVLAYVANKRMDLAELVITELLKANINHKEVNDSLLIFTIYLVNVELNDYDSALKYIEILIQIDPANTKAIFYRMLILVLSEKYVEANIIKSSLKDDVIHFSTITSEEVTTEIHASEILEDESSDENSEQVENWDHQLIHLFFQRQKETELLDAAKSLEKKPANSLNGFWKIGEVVYSKNDNDVFDLQSKFHPHYFVAIDRNISVDKKFQVALKNRYGSKSKGKNCIKIINNCLIEAKLVGVNNRLFTTTIYVNNEGQTLALLNTIAHHTKIKNILKNRKDFDRVHLSESYMSSENKGGIHTATDTVVTAVIPKIFHQPKQINETLQNMINLNAENFEGILEKK